MRINRISISFFQIAQETLHHLICLTAILLPFLIKFSNISDKKNFEDSCQIKDFSKMRADVIIKHVV